MLLEFQQKTKTKRRLGQQSGQKNTKHPFPKMLILLIGIAFVGIYMSQRPFIKYDKDGNAQLADWRQEKLDRELEELENAEQYALRATIEGWYPCASCIGRKEIYLYPREVWKYGTTTKGQEGRYSEGLPDHRLSYFIEYEGSIGECLRIEKIKIVNYAIAPENLKRKIPLIRPPGNKRDR